MQHPPQEREQKIKKKQQIDNNECESRESDAVEEESQCISSGVFMGLPLTSQQHKQLTGEKAASFFNISPQS